MSPEQCDAVVVIGSDYTDVVNPSELSFNARIAVNLGAPVLLGASTATTATPDEVISEITAVCAGRSGRAHTPTGRGDRREPLRPGPARRGHRRPGPMARARVVAVPEIPLLVAPTMAELLHGARRQLLQRRPGAAAAGRRCSVMVGGMTAEHILDRLIEGQVVIAPGRPLRRAARRLVNAHEAEGFPVAGRDHHERRPAAAPGHREAGQPASSRTLPLSLTTDTRHLRHRQRVSHRPDHGSASARSARSTPR